MIEAQKTAEQERSDMELYRTMVNIRRKGHEAANGKKTTAAKIELLPIYRNTNAASLRLRNKKDMQQHMHHVYSQISIQKAERSRKIDLMRSEKAIAIQALVRGYLERRRHRGLLRHIERSMDLNRISLRKQERTG
jgi:hypothetical protein